MIRELLDRWRFDRPDAYERNCRRAEHLCVCGRHRHRQRHVVIVDRQSLRRRRVYYCGRPECQVAVKRMSAAQERTLADWELEHPVPPITLEPLLRPQYPSASRRALRVFVESGMDAATVDGSDPATLNLSAGALGLKGVYAEQRSGTTALRRTRKAA